ncbi:hypothetical protein DM872_10140 [Pseudomonas taiwanensis]|nr:hypothetical protein [Pseudomonas taiwanensis]
MPRPSALATSTTTTRTSTSTASTPTSITSATARSATRSAGAWKTRCRTRTRKACNWAYASSSEPGIPEFAWGHLLFPGWAAGGAIQPRHRNPPMIRSLGFGRKLLLATSLLVVVSFSFFTLHNDAHLEPAQGRVLESRVKDAGRLAANSVEHWLGGRLSSIELVAQSLLKQGMEGDARNVLTLQTVRDGFVYAYLGRADGSFQMATDDPAPDGYDPRTRPWYHAARDAGATVITEPYLDATQSQLMVTVAMPLICQGQLQGVVGGDLGLDTLTTIINALDFNGIGHRHRGTDRRGRLAEHGHHRAQHPQPGRRGKPPGDPARLCRPGPAGRAPAAVGGQLPHLTAGGCSCGGEFIGCVRIKCCKWLDCS